jgi:probable HAF family extracellular repeat protein
MRKKTKSYSTTALERDPRNWSDDKGVLVTGWANNAQQVTHAFLYKDHRMRDLGTLPGGTTSIGYAVNPSGEVAGMADEAIGYVQPVLFPHGNFISLGTLGGCCDGIRKRHQSRGRRDRLLIL